MNKHHVKLLNLCKRILNILPENCEVCDCKKWCQIEEGCEKMELYDELYDILEEMEIK